MTETSCILARKQIMVTAKGKVSPCCNFSKSIPIEQYQKEIEIYASKLEQGERIPECSLCWEAEDRGIMSVRQSSNLDADTYSGEGVTALDIRLHNKCNLACNMCHDSFSTLWGKLKGRNSEQYISGDLLESVIDLSNNLSRLSLQGGEPFYGTEYVDFVNRLSNKQNIALDMFTNIITVDLDAITEWNNELKHLRINASVDGFGEVFDTIRWPTTWGKFSKNAKKVYDIIESKISFFYTVQASNINSIYDFMKWRNENCKYSAIVFNMVIHNDELTYKALTAEERDLFLSNKENILSCVNNKTGQPGREAGDLLSIFSLVENMTIDNELIEKRNQFDLYINKLRSNKNVK